MSNTAKDPAVTSHANAPARTITANGTSYAYRELVPTGGIPVIFFVHLAANLDNWDPRILDPIAATRHVIAFDNKRVGASTGQVQDTIEEMAEGAFEFIKALVFQTIDVFSFSLGGMVAQALVTAHPKLVRKLVLAGTGPKGGKDMDKGVGATYYDMFRAAQTRSDPRNFSSSIEMPKVNAPPGNSSKGWKNGLKVVMHPSKWTTFQMQLKAIKAWGRGTPSDLGA